MAGDPMSQPDAPECQHEGMAPEGYERPADDPTMRLLGWRQQDYRCPTCGHETTMRFRRTRR